MVCRPQRAPISKALETISTLMKPSVKSNFESGTLAVWSNSFPSCCAKAKYSSRLFRSSSLQQSVLQCHSWHST